MTSTTCSRRFWDTGELASALLPPDHPQQQELGEITRVAERAASVTRQLLAFARRQTVQPRVLDLGEEGLGDNGDAPASHRGEHRPCLVAIAGSLAGARGPLPDRHGAHQPVRQRQGRHREHGTHRHRVQEHGGGGGMPRGTGRRAPGRIRHALRVRRWVRHGRRDAGTRLRTLLPPRRRSARGRAWDWPRFTESPCRTAVSSASRARVGEGTTMRVHFPRCEGTSQTNANACDGRLDLPAADGERDHSGGGGRDQHP